MKKLLLIGLLAFPIHAISADLIIGGWSYHPNDGYRDGAKAIPYNNKNKLIALDVNNFIIASFKNSYYYHTKAVGYEFKLNKYLGVMTLLTDTYEDVTPVKVGSANLMGILTLTAGPVFIMFVPSEVYTLAFRFDISTNL